MKDHSGSHWDFLDSQIPSSPSKTIEMSYGIRDFTRARLPHDLLCSYIVPETITSHLHDELVVHDQSNRDTDWNAFQVIPLVCRASNASAQSIYKKVFGVKGDGSLCEQIRPIYSQARKLWKIAKDAKESPEAIPNFKYRELMSSESLIQIYICIAISRRYLNADIFRPLSCSRTTTHSAIELLRLCKTQTQTPPDLDGTRVHWTQLPTLATNCSPHCKIQDTRMHRLYMPLTCAITLCDTICPEPLVYRVAEYIADITPWYSTVPILLNYIQDIDAFLAKEYGVSDDVYYRWIIQSLDLINLMDDVMQKFQNLGSLTSSFANVTVVPQRIYEVVGLRQCIERVLRSIPIGDGTDRRNLSHDVQEPDDSGPDLTLKYEIHNRAQTILAKLD